MLEDIKMEYKKIEKLKRQFYELINACQQYVMTNLNEFYDFNGISLREIDNFILFLRKNILDGNNKEKLLEMQDRLREAIKWATNKHISLASQQLQGKQISLSNGESIILANYEVPYIDGLFKKIADMQTYYKSNLSYFPEYIRFRKFERLNYLEYLKQLNLLLDEYSRKIAAIEAKKRFK